MADTSNLRMNLSALRRVDPYAKEILEIVGHVVFYSFNRELNEWLREDIEGVLFLYTRKGDPYHGIVILNRLNSSNLIEPITYGLDMKVQEHFLFYRNDKI